MTTMIARLRPPLDCDDLAKPVVAAAAITDLSLDTLVAALFAEHPRLEHELFLRPDGWDIELRHAQLAASLARALQRTLVDYVAVFAERKKRDDFPF
jgi:hypothetical protein